MVYVFWSSSWKESRRFNSKIHQVSWSQVPRDVLRPVLQNRYFLITIKNYLFTVPGRINSIDEKRRSENFTKEVQNYHNWKHGSLERVSWYWTIWWPKKETIKRSWIFFTKHSHDRNITLLYLCQEVFPPGKFAKSISWNTHYILAFKNPREQLGMRNLLLQSYHQEWQHVMEVYRWETKRPFGYLTLDCRQANRDIFRIVSRLLKEEGCMKCFVSPITINKI